MFKVQEFYCEDTPVDENIREAIIYANTHNCTVKITTWLVSSVCRMLSEYIFPNENFEEVRERFKYLMGRVK